MTRITIDLKLGDVVTVTAADGRSTIYRKLQSGGELVEGLGGGSGNLPPGGMASVIEHPPSGSGDGNLKVFTYFETAPMPPLRKER